MTIEEILAKDEKQIFDRKSIHIKPADLSDTLCAFANADGGTVAIGISDKHRRIEGVDYYVEQLNDLLRTPIDFCNPTIPVTTEMVECINCEGKPDHVLLMHIEASPLFHANQADDAFIRVGDKSKKLNFEDRMALMYAKGVRYYEDEPVADASIEDLDLDFVRDYVSTFPEASGKEHESPSHFLTRVLLDAGEDDLSFFRAFTSEDAVYGNVEHIDLLTHLLKERAQEETKEQPPKMAGNPSVYSLLIGKNKMERALVYLIFDRKLFWAKLKKNLRLR